MFDKRAVIILSYVLLPALLGAITRLAGVNSGIGDFYGLLFSKAEILEAFGNLILIVFVFSGFILIVLKPRTPINNKLPDYEVSKKIGRFILYLQLGLLLATIFLGFGKAAGEVEIKSGFKYLFILIPINYLFLIYFVQAATSDKMLKINCMIYIVTSVFQGWAGGLLILVILVGIRFPRYFSTGKLFIIFFALVTIAPLLIALRELIRQPQVSMSVISGLDWFSFRNVNFGEFIYFLINRFDLIPATLAFDIFHSGISSGLKSGAICFPWQENIYYTIVNNLFSLKKCVSVGETLPSMIQGSFFWYRKTSFSIGAGWIFSSDYLTKIAFVVFALSALFMARLFAGKNYQRVEVRLLILFVSIFLFIPGWYFNFFQFVNALLIYQVLKKIPSRLR